MQLMRWWQQPLKTSHETGQPCPVIGSHELSGHFTSAGSACAESQVRACAAASMARKVQQLYIRISQLPESSAHKPLWLAGRQVKAALLENTHSLGSWLCCAQTGRTEGTGPAWARCCRQPPGAHAGHSDSIVDQIRSRPSRRQSTCSKAGRAA